MQKYRALTLATAALLLGLAPLVVAHGDDEHGGGMDMDMAAAPSPSPAVTDGKPPSYWSHPEHAGLMYMHILLMTVGWVMVLPIGMCRRGPWKLPGL